MSEFIKLAHTVIDADDHASLTALEELKTKWETRFGKEAAAKSFPATTTLTEPPLAIMVPDCGGKDERRSTEIRPVIHGGAAFPSSHGKEVKSADAIADVGVDSAADVGADCDDDITAELSDDISAAGKKTAILVQN
ncbi:UNVERIFIED_CONTAM: hypothetical protein Sindi_1697800 [Sesamum indicum]